MGAKRKAAALSACLLVAFALAAGATAVYLQNGADVMDRAFQNTMFKVTLAGEEVINLSETSGSEYSIVPGMSVTKDPKVTLTATMPSYVFVKVDDKTSDLVSYEIDSAWTKVPDLNEDGVYYRVVDGQASPYELYVLKDNKVTYNASITDDDMSKSSDELTLGFTSYVLQRADSDSESSPIDPKSGKPQLAWMFITMGYDGIAEVTAESDDPETNYNALATAYNNSIKGYKFPAVFIKDEIAKTYSYGTYFNGKNLSIVGSGVDKTIFLMWYDSQTYLQNVSISNASFAPCSNTSIEEVLKISGDVRLSDCVIAGDGKNAVGKSYANGDVLFERCEISSTKQSIMFDGGSGGSVTVKDCTVTGNNTFGNGVGRVILENTTFDPPADDTRGTMSFYQDVEFSNCKINPVFYQFDVFHQAGIDDITITFNDCDCAGVPTTFSVAPELQGHVNIVFNKCENVPDLNKLMDLSSPGVNFEINP